jgi:AAA+ ATPase superfamily predicted ATPase
MRDRRDDERLRLLIAGSDVSFFEQEVVGYAATSYGRRTGSLHIEPFASSEVAPFLPGWSIEDRIRVWAVFGGMPYYLDEIDPERDLPTNIHRAILAPGALLRSEPEFLLAQESRIRDRAIYMSALRAIAGGATRLGEIANRLGRKPEEARAFLETLEEMGLVRRRHPVGRPSRQKVSYAITDPFMRFWFRFVAPYESRLQTREAARRHLDETVLPELDHFVSRDAFEEVCQEWMLRHVPNAVEVGRWWGSRRARESGELRTRQYEADVVAIDSAGRVLALGSCKWSADEHPVDELVKLETVGELLEAPNAPLYFFDRTGFSFTLRELDAQRADVNLIAVCDLDTI